LDVSIQQLLMAAIFWWPEQFDVDLGALDNSMISLHFTLDDKWYSSCGKLHAQKMFCRHL
jgi:hypothetical protein